MLAFSWSEEDINNSISMSDDIEQHSLEYTDDEEYTDFFGDSNSTPHHSLSTSNTTMEAAELNFQMSSWANMSNESPLHQPFLNSDETPDESPIGTSLGPVLAYMEWGEEGPREWPQSPYSPQVCLHSVTPRGNDNALGTSSEFSSGQSRQYTHSSAEEPLNVITDFLASPHSTTKSCTSTTHLVYYDDTPSHQSAVPQITDGQQLVQQLVGKSGCTPVEVSTPVCGPKARALATTPTCGPQKKGLKRRNSTAKAA